jgi:hypothetical protein
MNWFTTLLEQLQPYAWTNAALTVLLVMSFIYGLLIVRQARQMTTVLPTPLSPPVHFAVILYCVAAAVAFFLGVGIIIASF